VPINRTTVQITLALFVGSAGQLAAQQRVSLTKPAATFDEPFTTVSGLRELPGGKVIVSDARDKVVQLVDFASGSSAKIGREGSGPAEYGLPGALFAMPDGTTILQDMLNRRFLVLGPDGKPTGNPITMPNLSPPPTPGEGGRPGGMRMGFANAQGVDGRGRLYFQPPSFTPDGTTPDSGAIVRWTPKGTAETDEPAVSEKAGHVRLARNSQTATNRGGEMRVMIGMAPVFSAQEMWGVDAAGRIARVSPAPYQVHWIADGKVTSGPVVPYTPAKVTQADKDEFLEARRRNPPTMVSVTAGPGGTQRRVGPPPGGMPEPEFAETKPPFTTGQGSVQVTPEGEVWVLRTRPAGDKVPTYDVFDRNGVLVKQVVLNPRSRVVGFGRGSVYVTRSDEDDLQYLERYSRP
jgi:hypothetical protein